MGHRAARSVTDSRRARAPWVAPWLVGIGLRIVAALVGFGWFAPDDYHFVIEQSGHWLQDPGASFPCDYRSNLLPRLFWLVTAAAHAVGFDGPTARLRCAYLVVGLVSTAIIPAVYKLTARHTDALTARTAAWLAAAFFLMPRITTRALIEIAAMVPLVWGALWLDRARSAVRRAPTIGADPHEPNIADSHASAVAAAPHARTMAADPHAPAVAAAFGAAVLIGAACLFRFQVGVLLPAVFALLVTAPSRRSPTMWAGFVTGGVLVALMQAGLDASEGRAAFATPMAYLRYNLGHAQEFGESPWFTYVGHFLTYTLPPATLVLLLPLVRAWRKHVVVAVLLCTFVTAHSLVGHKEDRFMFPVLPLFFVLLATALEEATRAGAWRATLARGFWVVNGAALLLATCSDPQRNLTRPFLRMARAHDAPSVATVGLNLVPRFYLDGRGDIESFASVEALRQAVAQGGAQFDFVLLRHAHDVEALKGTNLNCDEPRLYYGDWLDRLLVRVNRHNARRDATALLTCGKARATCIRCGA